ncbi:ketopantoate reductase C-terminal domain-containing protein [Microbulbifer sp. MLAF003]|uniref:ketopantoate reductase family protein n=1 Tax=Microbulbifer sp. MLAF003 TaxID=3032582 RepID=UPI0024AD1CA9|nr:ketopantoate reductase C-terminal domain-containing protein [Microbulbifer sp. MLAF003]WHI49296.1 ketopantoate reductase C-terminal domain-containing protein [Microbulbifer sp. MLAF003]
MKDEKILVLGAGSVGSYLATKLYNAQYHVDVIGRKAEKVGRQLYINNKKYNFPPVSKALKNGTSYDIVLLTSKLFDVKENLDLLAKSKIKSKINILLQNCIFDTSEFIGSSEKNTFIAVVNDGFNLRGNQLTYIRGKGFLIEKSEHTCKIYSVFKDAEIEIATTKQISQQRAIKAIFNCSTNIFSAIYLKNYKGLFEDEKITKRIRNTYFESYDILSRKIEFDQSKETLWDNIYHRVKDMNHYPSTYQDIKENKKTEIASLNGHIVELGRKMNIPTPYNSEAIKEFKSRYPNLY